MPLNLKNLNIKPDDASKINQSKVDSILDEIYSTPDSAKQRQSQTTPKSFDAGSGYTGKIDQHGDTTYVSPSGTVSSDLPYEAQQKYAVENNNQTVQPKNYVELPQENETQKPINRVDEAAAQGFKDLWQEARIYTADNANLITGSQKDASKAIELLNQSNQKGIDLKGLSPFQMKQAFELNDFKKSDEEYKKEMDEWKSEHPFLNMLNQVIPYVGQPINKNPHPVREDGGLGGVLDFSEYRNEAPYRLIQEALKTDNPQAYLEEKAKQQSWGDKTEEDAMKKLAEDKPVEGVGGYVGGLIPVVASMVPAAAASLFPATRPLAQSLGELMIGAQSYAGGGEAIANMRNYAAQKGINVSEGDVLKQGLLSSILNEGLMHIPLDKILSGAGSLIGKKVTGQIADELAANPTAAKEAQDFFDKAAEWLKSAPKAQATKFTKDALASGGAMATLNAGNSLLPMLYEKREDYHHFWDVMKNASEGMVTGILMHSILSVAPKLINNVAQNNRRIKQGNVILADAGDHGVVEVLGVDNDNVRILKNDGTEKNIPKNEINKSYVVPWQEFKEYANAYKAGSAGKAKAAADANIQNAAEGAVAAVNENVNPDMGGTVKAKIGGTERQITKGKIVTNEDGSINQEQSDPQVYYKDDEGNTQIAPIAHVEELTQNTPQKEAIGQEVDNRTKPLIAQQENDEVREYNAGENVRFNTPDGNSSMSGQIQGKDNNGNYIITVEGFQQPAIVEPRQIINEDNLKGVDNGSIVEYTDNGVKKQGTVQDAYGLRSQGLIDIDGDVVPVESVIGLYNPEEASSKPNETPANTETGASPQNEYETKKADIERRRQEELNERGGAITVKQKIFEGLDDNNRPYQVRIEYKKDGRRLLQVEGQRIQDNVPNWVTINTFDGKGQKSLPDSKLYEGILYGDTKVISEKNVNSSIEKKINAKYDAELSALEQSRQAGEAKPEATAEPSQNSIENVAQDLTQKYGQPKIGTVLSGGGVREGKAGDDVMYFEHEGKRYVIPNPNTPYDKFDANKDTFDTQFNRETRGDVSSGLDHIEVTPAVVDANTNQIISKGTYTLHFKEGNTGESAAPETTASGEVTNPANESATESNNAEQEKADFYDSLPKNKSGEVDEKALTPEQHVRYAEYEVGKDGAYSIAKDQYDDLQKKIDRITKQPKTVANIKTIGELKERQSGYEKYMSDYDAEKAQGAAKTSEEEKTGSEEKPVNEKGIEKAEREGGQILILSPDKGSAAALSALPSNSLSTDKSTANNSDSQESSGKNFVSEHEEKPLTRVEGLGMGQNQAKGVYVSYETDNEGKPANRYETEDNKAKPVEVSMHNPITFDQNQDEFAKFRQQTLLDRLDDFKASDFSYINEGEVPTVDNLNEQGIDRLAGFVTEELQKQGHDGIVFGGEGEHEIVVFDKNNVREKTATGEKPKADTGVKSKPETRKTKSATPFQKRLDTVKRSIESLNDDALYNEDAIENEILYGIASGRYKFKWRDSGIQTEKDKGTSTGTARELGFLNKEGERKSRISILSKDGYTPNSLAHELWERSGGAVDTQTIRNKVIDILNSVNSRKDALEMLESKKGISEEEYYARLQEESEIEQQIRNEEESQNNEIQQQLVQEDLVSLLNEAEKLGVPKSELDNTHTFNDIIDLIEQHNDEIQRRRTSRHTEQNEVSESKGNKTEPTEGTTGEGNRSAEDTGTEGKDTDRKLHRVRPNQTAGGEGKEQDLTPLQQKNVEATAAQSQLDIEPEKSPQEKLDEVGGDLLAHAQREAKSAEIKSEEEKVDTNPSEAQKEAGNYQKGHVKVQGFDISIENPKGSERSGTDENGEAWSQEMKNSYGYIRGTEGKDGDHIDVFLGDNSASKKVFVVDQNRPSDGKFDEHKVMLGFNSIEEARDAYLSNYEDGWKGLRNITETTVDDFSKWANKDGARTKPFAEYRDNQKETPDDVRLQTGKENAPSPITKEQGDALIERLKAKGLTKDVILYDGENDEQIKEFADRKEFKDKNGTVYGFATGDGRVFIDRTKLNANTPIHEFGHLYWNVMPAEMKAKITELLKQTPKWKELEDNPAYSHLKTDDQKADEIFNTILGNEGESSQKVQEIIGNDVKLTDKIKSAINDVWEWVKANIFQNADAKINQFAKKTLGELLNGKPVYKEGGDVLDFNRRMIDWRNNNSDNRENNGSFTPDPKTIMLRQAKSVSEAQELIKPLANKPMTNDKLGMTATLSKKNIGKLGSEIATKKSISSELHAKAIVNIDTLFKNAEFDVTHPDTKGRPEITQTHRLGSLMYDEKTGEYVPVMITALEHNDGNGNKIYSIEAVDVEAQKKSTGQLSDGKNNPHDPIADFNAKIQQLIEDTKNNKKNENNVRFHAAPDNQTKDTEEYRKELDKKIKNVAFRLREAWEDQYLAVREFLDVLRKAGTDIKDYNDFYLQATLLQGKNDAQLEHYNEHFQKPLNESINALLKKGFSQRDVENYAILKHGLERNEYMRQKDIAEEKNPRDDYAGVSTVEKEAGMLAQQFIDNFEQKAGKTAIDDFWKKTNAATDFALRKQMEGGNIGKDIYDELKNRYKYYVPLRGHDADTAEDRWNYFPDTGTYFSNPIMTAEGRVSRSETPFAFIAQMAQSAINSANKNTLNQTMLRLARQDKTGLLTANKTWYINGVPQEAEYSENADIYRQNIEDFEKKMLDLQSKGLAEQKRGKLDIGDMFIKPSQEGQHAIRVRQNGQEYTVYINGNPAVSRAINGLNIVKQNDVNAIAKLTRGMAQMFTSKNPLFWMTNFSRDYHFATSMLSAKEGVGYMLKFQKNIPASFQALQRHLRGKGDMTKKEDRYLSEYIMNGGKTGFSHLIELNKIQKQVEHDIKKGNKKNMLNNMTEAIEGVNDLIENMTRFSTYITSRDAGRSVIKSVSDAKEVTVNFNRKGAGGMGANWIRPLYVFTNAGVQGMSNFSRTFREHPGKMTALILTHAFTGAVLCPMIAAIAGGEDGEKEYWNLSDYDRQNYLCIYAGKGFIKIPLAQELRVFHGLGDNMAQAVLGKKDGGTAFLDALSNFADLIPTDPAGAATATFSSYKNVGLGQAAKIAIATLSPDFIKPITQLAANRNFMGGQIYKENQKAYRPGYMKVRTNKKGEAYVPLWLVDFAKATDNFTGGDGVEGGLISLNPDMVQHFVKGYAGGIYDLFSNGIEAAYKASKGENIEIRDTPIKRFYTSADDTEKMNQGMNAKYYDIAKEVDTNLSKAKDYENAVDNGTMDPLTFSDKLQKLNYEKSLIINEYVKDIKDIEKQLPELDEEGQNEAENDIIGLKQQVIELNDDKGQ